MTHKSADDSRNTAQIPHTDSWQPVTPTSPPWDGVPVLVWHAKSGVWVSGRYRDQRGYGQDWYFGQRRCYYPPTHWMPLPEPPIVENEK